VNPTTEPTTAIIPAIDQNVQRVLLRDTASPSVFGICPKPHFIGADGSARSRDIGDKAIKADINVALHYC
jgi:hypothetical protein